MSETSFNCSREPGDTATVPVQKNGWIVCWSNIVHTYCVSGFNQKLYQSGEPGNIMCNKRLGCLLDVMYLIVLTAPDMKG